VRGSPPGPHGENRKYRGKLGQEVVESKKRRDGARSFNSHDRATANMGIWAQTKAGGVGRVVCDRPQGGKAARGQGKHQGDEA